jgi:hypothetical protein
MATATVRAFQYNQTSPKVDRVLLVSAASLCLRAERKNTMTEAEAIHPQYPMPVLSDPAIAVSEMTRGSSAVPLTVPRHRCLVRTLMASLPRSSHLCAFC